MNGFYKVNYRGMFGTGFALLFLKDGVLGGVTVGDGIMDGTYDDHGNGKIRILAKLTFPPGAQLVTGVTTGNDPWEIDWVLYSDGRNCILADPKIGKIEVSFQRLRDIP